MIYTELIHYCDCIVLFPVYCYYLESSTSAFQTVLNRRTICVCGVCVYVFGGGRCL